MYLLNTYTPVRGDIRSYLKRSIVSSVQFLDVTDCISHSTNTLGKGMNPIILPPVMGKIVGQTRFFNLGEATSLGEGKL